MTSEGDTSTHARFQQVLTWRTEGVTYSEIGRRLGVSGQRAKDLDRQAQRWQQRTHTPHPTAPANALITPEMPLDALPISAQAKTSLRRAGVQTVGEVAALSEASLLRMPAIGVGTVATVRAFLRAHYPPAGRPVREEGQ